MAIFRKGASRTNPAAADTGLKRDRRALADAITEMLSCSIEVSLGAHAMGETMKIRSGLGEGIDVLAHLRKPLDPWSYTTGWRGTWRLSTPPGR